jgi:transcriptional regulator with XRE-family HTH domain
MPKTKAIREQLRAAVERSGMTRYAIAKAAGISQIVLDRFMSRERDIRSETLEKIAEAIDFKPRDKAGAVMWSINADIMNLQAEIGGVENLTDALRDRVEGRSFSGTELQRKQLRGALSSVRQILHSARKETVSLSGKTEGL